MWWKLVTGYLFLLVFIMGAWNLTANVDRLRAWKGMRYMSDDLNTLRVKLVRMCWVDAGAISGGAIGMGAVLWSLLS